MMTDWSRPVTWKDHQKAAQLFSDVVFGNKEIPKVLCAVVSCGASAEPHFTEPDHRSIWLCSAHYLFLTERNREQVEELQDQIVALKDAFSTALTAGKQRLGVTYFLKRKDGLIKIGRTSKLRSRLYSLTKQFEDVKYLGCIPGMNMETLLHRQFAKYRRDGEWFEPHHSLMQFIREKAQ